MSAGGLAVHVAAVTDRGQVRPTNEDRVGVFGWLAPVDLGHPVVLFTEVNRPVVVAVADGLGGHLAGEVASRHAVEAVMADPAALSSEDAIAERLRGIHRDLLAAGAAPSRSEMATTLSVVVLLPDAVMIGNVGDSRVYYVEPNLVDQLTTDDVDAFGGGALSQVLGGLPDRPMEPRLHRLVPGPATRLLICSDGLHGYVSETDLRAGVLLPTVSEAAAELIGLAMRAGAPDNVSLCLLEITRLEPLADDDD